MLKQELLPGALLHELMRARHNAVHAELTARGLGALGAPMLLFALHHLERERGPVMQRDLAAALGISPATVAMSVKSLEKSGYVEKGGDPKDARRSRIALTAEGARALESCGDALRAVDARMFAGVAPAELEAFTGILSRMRENLGEQKYLHFFEKGGGGGCSKN